MVTRSLLCHLVELSDFGYHIHCFANLLFDYTINWQCTLRTDKIPTEEVEAEVYQSLKEEDTDS